MDVTADLDAPVVAAAMYRWVADLERYPQWLEIVARATPAASDPDDVGPAWFVLIQTVARFFHPVFGQATLPLGRPALLAA